MSTRREDNKQRATHIRLLESLDEVIRQHPAGSHMRTAQPSEDVHRPLRAVPADADNVVDLRSRFAMARTTNGATPDDAA